MKILQIALIVSLICHSSLSITTYQNPLINNEFSDPAIIQTKQGIFYLYGSQGNGATLQAASSTDLVTWIWHGEILPDKPRWATVSPYFWGPSPVYTNNRYYLYFAARQDADVNMCIGVAISDNPLGPFTDVGNPILCGEGYSAIDPHVFFDGKQWLIFWGSDSQPIYYQPLTQDMLTLKEGTTPTPILFPSGIEYEGLVEGIYIWKKKNYFYAFYSGDVCCGTNAHSAVMVARATSLEGPWTKIGEALKFPNNAILQSNSEFLAPGHCCIVTDLAGHDWLIYHAIDTADSHGGTKRVVMMDKMLFDGPSLWPSIEEGSPSSHVRQAPQLQ